MSQGREKMLRVNVAAERLKRTERTIRRMMKDGRINFVEESPRRRFIPESAVEAIREKQA